jgi:SAM-dependent methyltransferase
VDVRASYDSAAQAYADHPFNELEGKPLDRHLLDRFAEAVSGGGLVADLGCGPGHVAKYLNDRGVPVFGVDLSPSRFTRSYTLHPMISRCRFVNGDGC